MPHAPIRPNQPRLYISSLDTLRILAMVLVTWQHYATVIGYFEQTQWRGISPGQTGVALFCAISGYLAMGDASAPRTWLWRRLAKIFPAYWVVTIAAFSAALVVPLSKPVTLVQFISQMLGTGFFTHGWELVNVVSWFISLILLCYLLLLGARRFPNPTLALILVVIVAAIAASSRIEVSLSRHILAFFLGALSQRAESRDALTLVSVILVIVGCTVDPQLFYGGIGSLGLLVALRAPALGGRITQLLASYSYEYYLVHGLILFAAARFTDMTWAVGLMAIVSAMAAATVLQVLTAWSIGKLQRVWLVK